MRIRRVCDDKTDGSSRKVRDTIGQIIPEEQKNHQDVTGLQQSGLEVPNQPELAISIECTNTMTIENYPITSNYPS